MVCKAVGHIARSLATCRPGSVSRRIRHIAMAQEVRVVVGDAERAWLDVRRL